LFLSFYRIFSKKTPSTYSESKLSWPGQSQSLNRRTLDHAKQLDATLVTLSIAAVLESRFHFGTTGLPTAHQLDILLKSLRCVLR
jgi:hypothetical protein